MIKVFTILIVILTFNLSANSQTLSFPDLANGKWKYQDLPDSIKGVNGTLQLCPYNPSFWFKSTFQVDVAWNGFYFKDQRYSVSKPKNLLFVYIDSVYENVSGFICVFRPVTKGFMKLQYSTIQT